MKRAIKCVICVALLSIQTVMYSQNFINDTKQWAIVAQTSFDTSYDYFTSFFKFSGDTIFNGMAYHKLYRSTDSNQVNWAISSYWWERNDSVFQYCHPCGFLNDTSLLI